jgi:MoxR-like ATPase
VLLEAPSRTIGAQASPQDMSTEEPTPDMQQRAAALMGKVEALRRQVQERILGQEQLVDDLLVALLGGGHVLLEGLPGLGKTMLVRALAEGLGLSYSRVQFTPDLMPSDVTGTQVIDEDGGRRSFRFQAGPLFAGLVLADEINRATPKTQSALLEAMQERSVTVAGTTHELPQPFHVVATQNPVELEGTFPLPEAQLDRFMFRLDVRSPGAADMARVLAATTGTARHDPLAQVTGAELAQIQALVREVLCGSHLVRHVAELICATHPDNPASDDATRRFVRYGASARAGQAILLGAKARALMAGRPAVVQEDVDACLLPALRHRVLLGFEADAEHVQVDDLLPSWQAHAQKSAGA